MSEGSPNTEGPPPSSEDTPNTEGPTPPSSEDTPTPPEATSDATAATTPPAAGAKSSPPLWVWPGAPNWFSCHALDRSEEVGLVAYAAKQDVVLIDAAKQTTGIN